MNVIGLGASRWWFCTAWTGFSVLLGLVECPKAFAQTGQPSTLPSLQEADAALKGHQPAEAVRIATQLIQNAPKDHRPVFLRATAYDLLHEYPKALADYTAGLELDPKVAFGYQNRGAVYFRLSRFAESVADFDKLIELLPSEAPQLWQRGISLYYAGRYEDGRKQFEQHQTVNPYDVENAVWHFLCVARASSIDKARAALIPIERDARVPMMKVHALFAGRAQPEDVLVAARAGQPSAAELDNRLFYAHLYLGLYYDALGELQAAREHIYKAATDFKADHYMGDVARVHAQLLRQANATQEKTKPTR
jgi:lipoprotein NlpI